ncbi:MAG: hypothetical protein ACOX8D_01275 [Methanoculleus sp.]
MNTCLQGSLKWAGARMDEGLWGGCPGLKGGIRPDLTGDLAS